MYTCPMHPQVRKNEPGRCPACGMELIPEHPVRSTASNGAGMQKMPARQSLGDCGSHADHEAAMTNPQIAKAMERDMRRRFFISLLLSIPIFLYSPVGINFFGLNLPAPIPVNWLLLILTTP